MSKISLTFPRYPPFKGEDAMEKTLAVFLAVATVILWGAIIQHHRSMEQLRPLGDQVSLEDIGQKASCQR